jgi:DedD protein
MADRTADSAELAVDELKRKARRRLVGAIVLALAAAIVLPLLLEKEPKPLGDEVSVQIPPVDEGRFVNRLTGRSGDSKSSLKADVTTDAATASSSRAAATEREGAVPATAPTPVATTATSGNPAVASSEVAPPKKSLAEAEQRVLSPAQRATARPEAKPALEANGDVNAAPKETAPTAAPLPTPPPSADASSPKAEPTPGAATPEKRDGFVVQLAAFADDKGANAFAGKLKKAGYGTAYVEPVETSRGTLWRVRVGGFGSRPDAEAARAKLKTEGYAGIVASAK